MFTLPTLQYDYAALEPHFDAQTMQIHHTKHHQTYVDKLNAALESHPELSAKSVDELLKEWESLPETVKVAVRNHGGGHANHSLFWQLLSPTVTELTPEAEQVLTSAFGSVQGFKEAFTAAATGYFGSGWAWLVVQPDRSLAIITTPNQDSPLMAGQLPLLGLDVWEHAYYLKYQNRRPEFIQAFWNVLNWAELSHRLAAVQ